MNAREKVEEIASEEWFGEAENSHLESLYDAFSKGGLDGALWTAWGSSCAIIKFLRDIDSPDLIDDYLRDLRRFAVTKADVARRSDLRVDVP